ncbi:MAG TPA: protein kinase [Polyangium sp.]|nr:protein kinase [Polyangium sp.]
MRPGTVIADRYEIVQLAGVGGMAEVYRSRDKQTGQRVALKLFLDGQAHDEGRFEREIAALGTLEHPGIVRLLDHGSLSFGGLFLVMEWLEGEDLERFLLRGPLSIEDTLMLGRCIANALAAAHAHGVVHRDLKPGNVFLIDRRPDQPKIVDFGIAKLTSRSRITSVGALMGTPGYMAPEQIRSEANVDARVDVFALGCLLYQCLAGMPAFPGDGIQAVLAKVLFAEPIQLRDHRPEIPAAVEKLIMRLLTKEPEARPKNGAAVVAMFEQLEASVPDSRGLKGQHLASLTETELRPVAALLIGRSAQSLPPPANSGSPVVSQIDQLIRTRADALGMPCERLPDGSLALRISGAMVASDLAVRAARLALTLRTIAPARPFSLAVGWGNSSGKNPLGDAIDRAARTLGLQRAKFKSSDGPIVLDKLTAGLLDGRFDIRKTDDDVYALQSERSALTGSRTLLGKPTPCVGRERELRLLEGLFEQCADESVPLAALVTSPAGMGKSRLAYEFVRLIMERNPEISLWIAGPDALHAGSALDLVSRLLSTPFGIAGSDSAEMRRQKIENRVGLRLAPGDTHRVSRFLGEIVGASFPDKDDLPLRSARASVQLMLDQVRAAFIEFVAAECAASPIVLVLEDLHWGDLPSIRLLDAALRNVGDRSLFILALARPDVHERFPKLWAGCRMQEIVLLELAKKASERLVRHALGEDAAQDLVDRIVAQAQGNTFYLEELVRATAEGREDAFPETIVAMVQSRLHSLEESERRILRAASIFGNSFWADGVATLLGKTEVTPEIVDNLKHLVEREILVPRAESRFSGHNEFAFRHGFVREGALAMLTPEDRVLGHALAGEWLERRGETDPLVLAGHFESGECPTRAAEHYLRAAERAYRAGDDDVATRRSERGLSLNPDSITYIGLLGILTEIRLWRNQHDEAAVSGAKLTQLAAPGSAPWVRGALAQFSYAMRNGHIDEGLALLDIIRSIDPAPEVLPTVSLALSMSTALLLTEGKIELVEPIQRRLEAIVSPVADSDPIARAYWNMAYPRWEAWIQENPWQSLMRAQAAYEAFTEAGSRRGQHIALVFIGMNEWLLGQGARASETLRTDIPLEEETAIVASWRSLCRVLALLDMGDARTARTEAEQLVAVAQSIGGDADIARGRWALAEVYRRAGVLGLAEREARAALELRGIAPLDEAAAKAILAAVRLADKRSAEAMLAIRDAAARYESLGAFGYRGAFMRIVQVEVLEATGQHGAAREQLFDARSRLVRIAESIPDVDLRRSYLRQVPENARTLDLAEKWFGDIDS